MNISQGEIWLVKFFPKVAGEISKERPAIVVSHNQIGRLPLKTIVPITDWKANYDHYPWMIKIEPSSSNRLVKDSAIDCFQIKNFSNERFVQKIGDISEDVLLSVHTTVVKTLNPAYMLK